MVWRLYLRIDLYGSAGDYLALGIDGIEIHVHGNAREAICSSWHLAGPSSCGIHIAN